ncbi:Predicted ATPase [Actinacidiphila yanglinensis]|uniref:Predicted ATPase n=1 Tax=Actinacidiphila yanglinensis TaxID=310779 RepID=A0A1H6A5A2_9ACTN|nr:BTAD domain-containing putative transcriptional regulator [Actinacidiphila yanglinensis]SEG43601.1 Predicted ATPase [Actinacidiphila yanglinensis]
MFGILGATRVVGADGADVALGGPRRRAVLALLALDAGRVVGVDRLIGGLYGPEVPAGAANAVQSQISRLRQVLPVAVEGHPAGYRLAVEPDQVDAHRFERLAVRGREALAAGRSESAAGWLREALGLWRGPALADVGDAPFAVAQAVRWEELRLAAVEDRVEADLALGRNRETVAELGELVALHPLRERLRGQLMRALYGSGRQSEALAAYDAARRELAESLGADPGRELAAVHLAVLRGDPSLIPAPAPAHASAPVMAPATAPDVLPRATEPPTSPAVTSGDAPHRTTPDVPRETSSDAHVPRGTSLPPARELPVHLTSFVGREAEIGAIGEQLAQRRLITLIGPGGAGKTRLALEVAGRHPDDAAFVELAALDDGAAVPQTVLRALGLREGGLLPAGGPGAATSSAAGTGSGSTTGGGTGGGTGLDPMARIAAALADRPLLLVLDNCEHVVAEAAYLAEQLLGALPLLRILATSREALGINGEALCPVPTLPLPAPGADRSLVLASPAVRLFVERAAAVRPDFDPTTDPATLDAVLRLCAVLDGLPLAIELAAARVRSLSVPEIAARLGALPAVDADEVPYSLAVRPDALFRLLSRGSRTAQPRQRTLRGVVDWSWELLPADERAVLRRASVFAGGWTLAAAEAVCADPPGTAGHGGTPVAGAPRIGPDDVLDLVAALVEKSLVVAQQPDAAGRVRYRMLESIRAYGAERLVEAGEADSTQHAHITYFLEFALDADPHLRRAEQVAWLRLFTEDRDNFQAALHRSAAAGDLPTTMRLIAALSSYWLLRGLRYEGAAAARQVLGALGPHPPDGMDEEYVLCVMAVVGSISDAGRYVEHVAAATRIVDGMNRVSRRFPVLTVLWAPFAGVPDESVDTLAVLEGFLAEWEDPWYRALGHLGAGFQSWMSFADAVPAQHDCTRALEGFRQVGDRWGMITCLNVLADIADYRGELQEAVALLGRALELAEELDSALDMADLLCNRAAYSRRAEEYEAAAAYCERAVELSRRAGSPESLALAHLGLAEAARLSGDLEAARSLCEQALAECPSGWFSSDSARSSVLVALGRIAVAEGDAAGAQEHFRAAATNGGMSLQFPMTASLASEAAAALAMLTGEPRRAALLLGAAKALRGGSLDGPDARATQQAARTALGEERYREAWTSTAELDRAQALERATASIVGE